MPAPSTGARRIRRQTARTTNTARPHPERPRRPPVVRRSRPPGRGTPSEPWSPRRPRTTQPPGEWTLLQRVPERRHAGRRRRGCPVEPHRRALGGLSPGSTGHPLRLGASSLRSLGCGPTYGQVHASAAAQPASRTPLGQAAPSTRRTRSARAHRPARRAPVRARPERTDHRCRSVRARPLRVRRASADARAPSCRRHRRRGSRPPPPQGQLRYTPSRMRRFEPKPHRSLA